VSIHIPAYREPPDMLKATLDAVAGSTIRNSNALSSSQHAGPGVLATDRGSLPHARERFKFIREDDVTGFKAGALRLALGHTAADAEIIAVIDADYVVRPDWLGNLVPAFVDRRSGWSRPAGPPRRRAQPHAPP